MSANPNNSPEQKAAWKANQRIGSRFVWVNDSPGGGKRSRKGWRAPWGSFAVRTLRALAGREVGK